jgi:hypothetical protein
MKNPLYRKFIGPRASFFRTSKHPDSIRFHSKTHRVQAIQRGINGRRNGLNILDIALFQINNAQQKIPITVQ